MTGVPRVERQEGPEVLWLDNGILRLGLVPSLGGRLLSLRLLSDQDGRELLWRNDDLLTDDLTPRNGHEPEPHAGNLGDWVNYGGDKTWPAPQGWDGAGQWAGPPDPVLDSGRYAATVEHDTAAAAVTLRSGDDPRTGLRLTRRFILRAHHCGYRLEITAHNTSARPVRWALWNVTQLAAEGSGGTMVAGPPRVTRLLSGTGFPDWTELPGDRVLVPHQDVVGKLGFPSATGWLAHMGAGATLTQFFTVDAGAEYPDQGSRAEVWLECPLPAPLAELGDLDPPARIVECEVLGPLTTLQPGESTTLRLDCAVTPGTAMVHDVTRAGHWTRPATIRYGRLTGEFVAYRDGVLTAGPREIGVRAGETVLLDIPVTGVPELELIDGTGEQVLAATVREEGR
ncbi:hypothetical protein BAY61_13490 [Prauserella marina]|uniref:Uncharacterized protein n=1 Tax=Prauserella marina TaxID=530584 RepID=A0A222VPK3_9PSEU|nr:DUF4380 domain-containing protein [Prauserella marina]ASR35849.1 hypothetical protein BAY61_13490 [Prauserella marina]PWV84238.1 uncharacterized protein DUF4380 [Prauserella marina]SDC27314.1 protein of unknown function [Prauserella marina]